MDKKEEFVNEFIHQNRENIDKHAKLSHNIHFYNYLLNLVGRYCELCYSELRFNLVDEKTGKFYYDTEIKKNYEGIHWYCNSCFEKNKDKCLNIENKTPLKELKEVNYLYSNHKFDKYLEMNQDKFERMLKEQNFCCGICGIKFDTHIEPKINRNHKTKNVCGLLCSSCNFGLKYFKDSSKNLRKASEYLNKHRNKRQKGFKQEVQT